MTATNARDVGQPTYAHAEIRARLQAEARRQFPDHQQPGGWDPRQTGSAAVGAAFGDDLGRGLLDAYALALHVLWTYQQAWAKEGFLPTAELETSVTALLSAIGYQPAPGTAALGLQHFRAVVGAPGLLPAGFRVASNGIGQEPTIVCETLHPQQLDPALNELRAWDPSTSSASTTRPPSAGSTGATDVARLTPAPAALGDRLAAGVAGDLAARRAARARVEMRRVADTLRTLRDAGGEACSSVMESLCEQLCAAREQAASVGVGSGNMTEAQKLARRGLGKLASGDAAALERALERAPGESDEAYRARLDAMARFLDGFVSGLVQDARDQLVLLRGQRGLQRLDRAVRGGAGLSLGIARPGTNTFVLLPTRAGALVARPLPMLRVGDWLVIGEELERIDAHGKPSKERLYREAVRVVATSEEDAPSRGGTVTRVKFEPPLQRGYRLERVIVLGNVVRISEGQSIEELLTLSLDGRTARLSQGPLTWLPSPHSANGRRPQCRVWIGEQEWTLSDNLAAASAQARVFAVEPLAGGATRLRFGDGDNGALVPIGESIRVRYRTGLGPPGNRAALRVDTLRDAHPSVSETFNPLPLLGGTPAEDTRAARSMAPAALRAMDRAVSLADVRALALTYSSVSRADVHRGAQRGEVRVTVIGRGGLPLDDTAALTAFLSARVAPGVRIVVENARRVPVFANILLRVMPHSDVVQLLGEVRVRLGLQDPIAEQSPGLLHPARVRIDGDLHLSEVYAALDGVNGLSSCLVRALYRTGEGPGVVSPRGTPAAIVIAAKNELLGWASTTEAAPGVVLELEEERDR